MVNIMILACREVTEEASVRSGYYFFKRNGADNLFSV